MTGANGTGATLSARDENGNTVTIIDRAPLKGEKGWFVDSATHVTMEQKLNEVLANAQLGWDATDYGWNATEDEVYVDGTSHSVTIEAAVAGVRDVVGDVARTPDAAELAEQTTQTAHAIANWLLTQTFPNDSGADIYARAYNNALHDAAKRLKEGRWRP